MYTVQRRGVNVKNNTSVDIQANAVNFYNQGDTDATISYNGILRIIKPDMGVTIGTDKADYRESVKIEVGFTGVGTNDLVLEEMYITRC